MGGFKCNGWEMIVTLYYTLTVHIVFKFNRSVMIITLFIIHSPYTQSHELKSCFKSTISKWNTYKMCNNECVIK